MTPQQLKTELFNGLHKTLKEVVIVDVSQVMTVIGVEETTAICLFCVEMTSTPKLKKKVLQRMAPAKRYIKVGMGGFNRLQLIEAIQNATTRDQDGTATASTPTGITGNNNLGAKEIAH